jgi:hypothetical protein
MPIKNDTETRRRHIIGLHDVPFGVSITRHMNANHELIILLRDTPFPVQVSLDTLTVHNSGHFERI